MTFFAGTESLVHQLVPMDPLPKNPTIEQLTNYTENIPTFIFIVLVFGWIVAAFIAGIVSTFIDGRTSAKPMMISVGIIQLLTYLNMLLVPGHPIWMVITVTLTFLPAGFIAYLLIRKKKEDTHV
jgi:predicted MFS family arabinose efflux permease